MAAGVGAVFVSISIILGLAIFALIVWAFVFWILMIVDCARRKFKQENDKIVWILVILFAQLIGAIIYYFVVKRN